MAKVYKGQLGALLKVAEEKTLILQPSANLRSSVGSCLILSVTKYIQSLLQDLSRNYKMYLISLIFGYYFQPLIHVNCRILLLFRIGTKKQSLTNFLCGIGKNWHPQRKKVVQDADFEANKLNSEWPGFLNAMHEHCVAYTQNKEI